MKKYLYSATCAFFSMSAVLDANTTTTYESSRAIRLRQKNLFTSYHTTKEQKAETGLPDIINIAITIQEEPNKANILQQKIESPAPVIETKIVVHSLDTKENIIQAPTNQEKAILQPASTVSTQVNPVVTQIAEKKIVTFKNNIDAAMITYHHWSGSYTPEFSITINKKALLQQETIECPCEVNEPFVITYHAKFPYGYSSSDQIFFLPDKFPCVATITFAWNKDPRVIITQE